MEQYFGLDAVVHAMESYGNRSAALFPEGPWLQAMGMIAGNIRTAYAERRDAKARANMIKNFMRPAWIVAMGCHEVTRTWGRAIASWKRSVSGRTRPIYPGYRHALPTMPPFRR